MATESIVLEEELPENYEPTDDGAWRCWVTAGRPCPTSPQRAEIHEYAKWLGMDMEEDRDLFWVAREGLKAPLPEHWYVLQLQEPATCHRAPDQS